jgi:elongation factor P
MEYLYRDGAQLYFMDKQTFEQTPFPVEDLGDAANIIPENTDVTFVMHGDDVLDVTPPDTVEVTVADTDPGLRGDTATGGSKPATTSTGFVVQVPLFIEKGNKITVNTNTGKYLGRV